MPTTEDLQPPEQLPQDALDRQDAPDRQDVPDPAPEPDPRPAARPKKRRPIPPLTASPGEPLI
jgi:hypothetical protein